MAPSFQKEEEIAVLTERIGAYAAKSSAIEEQLNRLERSQKVQKPTEIIKYVETEDSVALKHRVEELSAVNISLQGSLSVLRHENIQNF